MNIENIEWGLVCIIILIQFALFFRTKKQIKLYKDAIPQISSLSVSSIAVPSVTLEKLHPGEILSNLSKFKDYQGITEISEDNISEIFVIQATESNDVFEKVLYSINTYLIRNQGAVSDFNLLKDITERNADAIEDDINLTISLPLYLGLMGTMLGIVIGLFSMAGLLTGSPDQGSMANGITILLGGVKIAMIASFVGLFLTTLNSGWFFKGSKSFVETKKNEFYTLIQTELLPVVSQGLGATFDSLQRNLIRFNREFTDNINKISGLFITNYESLKLQESILSKLESIDVATVSKYNINVLKELQTSTKEFEKFNVYVSSINSTIENSTQIINSIGNLLQRTENIEKIGQNIDLQLDQSQSLLKFLSAHFQNLEEYKQLTSDSVAETGSSISDMFTRLKEHLEDSTQSVRDFTVEEVDRLKTALLEINDALKTSLSKSNIDFGNLQYLQGIDSSVSEFKTTTVTQAEQITRQLESLRKGIEFSNKTLKKLEIINSSQRENGLRKFLKRLFNSNGDRA